MNAPQELKYTKSHEWIKIEGDTATQGITDYAQNELSDIAFVDLPQVGDNVDMGNTCGNIEAVKAVSDLYAAVSGEIIEINGDIDSNPELINEDPFGKGWFFKVKMSDKEEAGNLMSADEYIKFVESQ